MTVSLGTRCLLATCSICSSIDVVESSLNDNLDRRRPMEYSDVSSQPESNLFQNANRYADRQIQILPFWCIHDLRADEKISTNLLIWFFFGKINTRTIEFYSPLKFLITLNHWSIYKQTTKK